MIYTQREIKIITLAPVTLGLTDDKGRKIGLNIERGTGVYTPSDSPGNGYTVAPGTYFALRIQATRNGLVYGASQPWRMYKSEVEREAQIQKIITATQKRAARNSKGA